MEVALRMLDLVDHYHATAEALAVFTPLETKSQQAPSLGGSRH